MSVFEDIGKKICGVGRIAADKTKDLADSAKTYSLTAEEERRLEKIYTAIGREYYSLHADAPDEELAGLVESAKESIGRINELKMQDNARRGMKICEKCGAAVPADSVFCNVCGVKMGDAAYEEVSDDETVKASYPDSGGAAEDDVKTADMTAEDTAGDASEDVPEETGEETAAEEAAKTPEKEPEESGEPETKLCRLCGTKLPYDAVFCKECGARQ